MRRSFKIPLLQLLFIPIVLMVGELVSGTSLYFAVLMAITLVSIGITYNQLGGMSTLSGICFSGFALRTIVISQFAKVILLEPADKNLEAPELTIQIYAVFYLSVMIGVYFLARVRVRVPRPLEPATESQAKVLYFVALVTGLVATAIYQSLTTAYGEQTQFTETRSVAMAFSSMLLFSLVQATEIRINKTDGRHSFGVLALIPWVAVTMVGFTNTSRTAMMLPTIVYFVVCYFKNYQFKKRHYFALMIGIFALFYVIGPFAIFTRGFIANKGFRDRIYTSFYVLVTHPNPVEWISALEQSEEEVSNRESYFEKPGTTILSRLSLIRADSNLISACGGGFHYGVAALMIDIKGIIPTFLYKEKPRYINAQDYLGHVAGVSSDDETNTYPAITAVADSFGAFGWTGVVLFPLLVIPAMFILYESMFDISRPWGIVAFGNLFIYFGELTVGRSVMLFVRNPMDLILLSYFLGMIVNMIPMKGEHSPLFHPPTEDPTGAI